MSSSRPVSVANMRSLPSLGLGAQDTQLAGTESQDVADSSGSPGYGSPRSLHTPLPEFTGGVLAPPRPMPSISNMTSNRDSAVPSSIGNSQVLLGGQPNDSDAEKDERSQSEKPTRLSLFKRPMFLLAALVALVVLILVIVLPVYFTVIKKKGTPTPNSSATTTPGKGPGSGPSTPTVAISGGDGSIVTTDTGNTFTYVNKFGGFCE
jgi:hypothetical protein